MNSIKYICQTLGIKYPVLASYLGLPVSTVSMAQSGRRSLPNTAAVAAVRLVQAAIKIKPGNAIPAANEIAELNEALNKTIEEAAYQLMVAEKKLGQMKQKYLQALTVLQLPAVLQQNHLEGKPAKQEKLWLAVVTQQAATQLKNNSLAKQALLQLQKEGWEKLVKRAEALKQ